METITVELYGKIPNNLIIRTPGRKFPGIVIQGDTLNSLYIYSEHICSLAKATQSEELKDLACELAELLALHVEAYETTLIKHNFELPYFRDWKTGQFPSKE